MVPTTSPFSVGLEKQVDAFRVGGDALAVMVTLMILGEEIHEAVLVINYDF